MSEANADHGTRAALLLGACGALGEALLAALIAAPRYRSVFFGQRHSAGAGTAKFRPWVIGTSLIVTDDACIVLSPPDAAPTPSPVRRFATGDALRAATVAHDTGARRLALIAADGEPIGDADAAAIAALGFDSVLIVQHTAPPAHGVRRWLGAWRSRDARSPAALSAAIVSALAAPAPGLQRLDSDALCRRHRPRT